MNWVRYGLPLSCLFIVGCGGTINVERDVEVKAFDIKAVIYTAKKDQELTVQVSSTEPVNAYLVYEKDREKVERQLGDNIDRPPEALDAKLKIMESELKASVKGGNEVAAVVAGTGARNPARVKVKAAGK